MTTFGSDYWPQTVEGRVVCWLLSLYALGVFGYITATLASHFIGSTPADPVPDGNLATLHTELAALREQLTAVQLHIASSRGAGRPGAAEDTPPHAVEPPRPVGGAG